MASIIMKKSRLEKLKSEHGSHSGVRRGCKCTECKLYSSEK